METDPRFTNQRTWLNSDYLLGQLSLDAAGMQQRIGDGFYEQWLIREQVSQLTGRRFLENYSDDEAQYRALMEAGVTLAQDWNLRPGVALSAEQLARLTSDIVWLVEESVRLPDGTYTTALVPKVYLVPREGDLDGNGTLISAESIDLRLEGDLVNSGTLAGRSVVQLSGDNLRNLGGRISGEDVLMQARTDLENLGGRIDAQGSLLLSAARDLTVASTTHSEQNSGENWSASRTNLDRVAGLYVSNPGGTLVLAAGQDITLAGAEVVNAGAGSQTLVAAGRDLTLAAVHTESQHTSSARVEKPKPKSVWDVLFPQRPADNHSESESLDVGTTLRTGGDLTLQAGGNLFAQAAQVGVGGDLQANAGGDLLIVSGNQSSSYSLAGKGVTVEAQESTQRSSGFDIAGSMQLTAGNDLLLMASQLKAGGDASLTAGNDIALLAGQNHSYSLTEYQHKGSFGRQTHQRDEVTDLSHVGSSVASGGNLTLQSGGDQRYQAANLQSDGDLTLDSGGAIAFEGVKDVHQENHASSSSDWSWMKTSGEGWTDETLRQSQLVAQGKLVIKAVEGIQLDIKEIDEHSVSQTIDAMVAADPQLAWLKEMEQRGDIDWQRVKEVHESYEYDQQGMGPATAIAVAIAVSAVTSGAASAMVGSMSAGAGTFMGAAGTVAGQAVGAGLGNVMATAALTSMASTAALSTINNGGDIDVVFKDVTSSDNLKGYVVAAGTAGVTSSGLSLEADLNSFSGIGKHAVNEVMGGATSIALSKALGQDASFHGLLEGSLINTLAAAGFNQIGNAGDRYNLKPGDAEMVAMHALMGGLVAKAQGGEFATGAMAAGVNEAVVADMDKLFQGLDEETRKNLLLGASQLVGLLAAAAQDPGGDGSHLNVGANVAKASTQYNHELHRKNADSFAQAVLDACAERPQSCAVEPGSVTQDELMRALETMAAHGEGIDDLNPDAIKLVNQYYQDERYRDNLENDLFYLTESEESRIKIEQTAELAMAATGMASAFKSVGRGVISWVKGLFEAKDSGQSIGRSLAYEKPSDLVQNRVGELQAQIPENSKGRITMGVAVVEDANGARSVLVGTSEPRGYLRPGVELKSGERVVAGTGHAEADIVNYASANGFKVIDIGATRPVCVNCQIVIEPTGANISTSLKQLPRSEK